MGMHKYTQEPKVAHSQNTGQHALTCTESPTSTHTYTHPLTQNTLIQIIGTLHSRSHIHLDLGCDKQDLKDKTAPYRNAIVSRVGFPET